MFPVHTMDMKVSFLHLHNDSLCVHVDYVTLIYEHPLLPSASTVFDDKTKKGLQIPGGSVVCVYIKN